MNRGVTTLGEPSRVAGLDEELDGGLGGEAAEILEGRGLGGDQGGELGGDRLVAGVEVGDVGGGLAEKPEPKCHDGSPMPER